MIKFEITLIDIETNKTKSIIRHEPSIEKMIMWCDTFIPCELSYSIKEAYNAK